MKILYEDNHLIAAEKEAGILTQGDYSGDESLMDMVKRYIKTKYGKPGDVFLGMVHRLDRPVSGIVLFSRTSKAASRLSAQFRDGTIRKFYLALTSGAAAPSGEWTTLTQFLVRGRGHSQVFDTGREGSSEVSLRYRTLGSSGGRSLVLIRLLTGKKHQIRAQLSSRGIPILGDADYGSPVKVAGAGIMLHAFALSFIHPTKKEAMLLTSAPPREFNEFWPIGDGLSDSIMDSIRDEIARPDNIIFDTEDIGE